MMRLFLASVFVLIITLFPLISFKNRNWKNGVTCEVKVSNNTRQIHEQILINSDEDFEIQNWPGEGTQENPYLIENLRIESAAPCILVNGTRKYVMIRDCHLWSKIEFYPSISSSGPTIQLLNVSNCNIIRCVIESQQDGIEVIEAYNCIISENTLTPYSWYSSAGDGIIGRLITNCTLIQNSIYNWSIGIELSAVNFSLIENNTIVENNVAIELGDGNRNFVKHNTIVANNVGIVANGENNVIFGNRIGLNDDVNVRDSGETNQWDDNISLGNGWDDYNGSGVYIIPGPANSYDRYPWICNDFSYTIIDYFGPVIIFYPWVLVTMTQRGPHTIHRFTAHVSDTSGVDSVLVFYRLSNEGPFSYIEMEHTPTENHPNQYSYELEMIDPYNIIINYYYWANDTLGNYRKSQMDRFYWHTYPDYTIITILIVLSAGGLTILFIIFKKLHKSG